MIIIIIIAADLFTVSYNYLGALDYNKYFSEGVDMSKIVDYNSSNTNQLNLNEMIELISKLEMFKS
jgi:hypothetical protein